MQTSPTPPEADFTAHARMWNAFTRFTVRGTITVIVVLLITGWLTGVL